MLEILLVFGMSSCNIDLAHNNPQGLTGQRGPRGFAGAQGDTGEQGPPGGQGPKGAKVSGNKLLMTHTTNIFTESG